MAIGVSKRCPPHTGPTRQRGSAHRAPQRSNSLACAVGRVWQLASRSGDFLTLARRASETIRPEFGLKRRKKFLTLHWPPTTILTTSRCAAGPDSKATLHARLFLGQSHDDLSSQATSRGIDLEVGEILARVHPPRRQAPRAAAGDRIARRPRDALGHAALDRPLRLFARRQCRCDESARQSERSLGRGGSDAAGHGHDFRRLAARHDLGRRRQPKRRRHLDRQRPGNDSRRSAAKSSAWTSGNWPPARSINSAISTSCTCISIRRPKKTCLCGQQRSRRDVPSRDVDHRPGLRARFAVDRRRTRRQQS